MILIFSQHITPRLQYITKFLFTGILQVPCKITTNTEEYTSFIGPRINYSFQSLDGIDISPKSILFKEGITEIDTDIVWAEGLPLLFHQCGDTPLPFDPFAASFYMLSRYEEYTNKDRDQHGRFLASSSLAGKNGFVSKPVVDQWAILLRKVIEKNYPAFRFPERTYRFLPTIDVDSVAAYKGKSIIRSTGASVKALLHGNLNELKERWKTLVLNKPDPFDTFRLFNQWHQEYNVQPIWFFLTGKHSKYDGNLPANNPLMKNIIKDIASSNETGIHPSYYSNSQPEIIRKEIYNLQTITGKKIIRSRQHFLRMELPITYQSLIECGIKEDYSMGFADLTGFRAGTCTPFPFYDLEKEQESELMIFPLIVMDATLFRYMNIHPGEASEICLQLINEVKNVKGTFITLWHNSFFQDSKNQGDWNSFYPQLLKIASE